MARPLKEGLDYFPHDTDSSNDVKIDAMRAMYGNDGYAFYFILLEIIYKTNDGILDVSKLALKASVAKKVGVSIDRFEEMLATACELELFQHDVYFSYGIITSNGVQKRLSVVDNMREKWRKKKELKPVFSGENKIISRENKGENPEKSAQRKEKKSKVKEIKEEDNGEQSQGVKKDHLPLYEISEDMIKIQKAYQEMGFGLFAGFVVDEVNSYIDDDLGILVLEALKEAQTNNKVSWAYAKKCIQSWITAGIKTIDQLEAARNARQQQKTQQIRGPDKRNNCGGFDQRKYSDEFYESLYETGEGG